MRTLGYVWDLQPFDTGMCTPMRHLGAQVGNFYLADKEGGMEFTDRDEEALLLFAAHGAAAIVNARTYRAEQRVRANLEALVETSPIGVVVFDPHTGEPVVFNRDARRFLEVLHTRGRPVEEMLERSPAALPTGPRPHSTAFLWCHGCKAPRRCAPKRSLSRPPTDGRSVSALVNTTPIHAEDGTVESAMVTVRDLAPIQELDRIRAEFPGMVSHELRTPLPAIKGTTATVLNTPQSFAPAHP